MATRGNECDTEMHERFDDEEKVRLVSLVDKHKCLFRAFSNTVTAELKAETWSHIAQQLNAEFKRGRTVKSLKDKWHRITIQVKFKCSDINRLHRQSGIHDRDVKEQSPFEELD